MIAVIVTGIALLGWIFWLQVRNASDPCAVSWVDVAAVYIAAAAWAIAATVAVLAYTRGVHR